MWPIAPLLRAWLAFCFLRCPNLSFLFSSEHSWIPMCQSRQKFISPVSDHLRRVHFGSPVTTSDSDRTLFPRSEMVMGGAPISLCISSNWVGRYLANCCIKTFFWAARSPMELGGVWDASVGFVWLGMGEEWKGILAVGSGWLGLRPEESWKCVGATSARECIESASGSTGVLFAAMSADLSLSKSSIALMMVTSFGAASAWSGIDISTETLCLSCFAVWFLSSGNALTWRRLSFGCLCL